MALLLDEEKFCLLKQDKNVCIVGKFPINCKRDFINKIGEKQKGYCTSFWSNGQHFMSSFRLFKDGIQ